MDYIIIPHLYFEGTRTFIVTISEDIAIILQNGEFKNLDESLESYESY